MIMEEAIKTLRELWRETNDSWYEEVYKVAIEAIKTNIVRCKDCKWWQDSEVGVVECPICTRIHDMVFEMGAYDYCAKGERKEESEV